MILAGFAFLGGVLALLVLPAEPTFGIVGGALLILGISSSWRQYRIARSLFWGACGFLFTALHAHLYLERIWPERLSGERVLAEALVDSIPVQRGDGWTFDARIFIETPYRLDHEMNARLISRIADVRPHAGERWKLLITLRPPRASYNPGAIDVERLYFHDRVHALGTIVASRLNQRLSDGEYSLDSLREQIALRIENSVTDRDAAALITALAVGVTGPMSREQWRVFNETGTTHLVAISGLHVTMLAMIVLVVARRVWSLCAWRWLSWNRDHFAAVLGLAAATGYAFLAGFSIPTQRTLIMLGAWLLVRCLARASPPLQPFAIALLVVLLLDPFAPLTAGFWLSFCAMGAILFVIQTRVTRRSALHEAVAVQAGVTITLAPLTLACFGLISVLGPIVNVAAIPYISWLMVPLILLSLLLMAFWTQACDLVLRLVEVLHDFGWMWLARAADAPMAIAHASPPEWWYVLAAIGTAIVMLPLPWALRAAVIVCVATFAGVDRKPLPRGSIEITALDVGEGTSIVVRASGRVLVYGIGESYGTDGGRAENVVVPFLRSHGVAAIDALIVSKPTPAAGAGVTALLAAMPVARTFEGGNETTGTEACESGEGWMWTTIRFQMRDACELRIEAAAGNITLAHSSLSLTDRNGNGWVIVAGRTFRNGRERPLVAALRQSAARVMATGDSGAIRIVIHPEDGVGAPMALRSIERAIWRREPV